ncbi:Conserved_hypothetical protein [Hexamita inflata]|uniref:Uncharacterized protein n=1 Tax=Hexamita inflata TaxID=28002 RepID=A0AA86NWZ5_9EUKA|nr:Conserved hypothetical protein [Hexamita inflata]
MTEAPKIEEIAPQVVEKPSLEQLILKKKEEKKQQKQDKPKPQEKKVAKQVERKEAPKNGKATTITIITKNNNSNNVTVVISGLPKTDEADVQKLVQETIGVKNVELTRRGFIWKVVLRSQNKAEELVKKLHDAHCKESDRNLKVFIEK